MTVASICQRDVDVAEPSETVDIAAQRMGTRQVGTLVVLGKGFPIGIVTDRDLCVRVLGQRRDPRQTRVEDVMTPSPRTILESEPIEEALSAMRREGVRRLPVVSSEGRLTGMVSLDDILRRLVVEFGELGKLLGGSGPQKLARDSAPAAKRRAAKGRRGSRARSAR